MSLLLSTIIGLVVVVFAVLALAPLLIERSERSEPPTPRFRVIEGGKGHRVDHAA